LAAAALLQPQPSLEANQEEEERSIDEYEDESIEEETEDLWGADSPAVTDESLSSGVPTVQVARPQLIPKASTAHEPAEDHQPVIAEDSGNYPLEEIHGDFTESEHCPHWSVSFADNLHLPLLNHIDQWGCITEVEVIQMLGSSRAARNFAVKLDQYAKLLPFEIKVQPSATGNRYMKTNN
jgi:hypothetical protein